MSFQVLLGVPAAVVWSSGAVGSAAERKAAREMRAAEEAGETERLKTLKENATLPLLFVDVEVCSNVRRNHQQCLAVSWDVA